MFWPILYTALTTICAFLSLIFSEIKPVIDFGLMMTMGLIVSFIITFTLLPTLINFVYDQNVAIKEGNKSVITSFFGEVSNNNKNIIFLTTVVIIIFSIFGLSRLKVENSFINYFNKDTEIYKGMKLIDEKLGGTTPLEIILKFQKKDVEDEETVIQEDDDWIDPAPPPFKEPEIASFAKARNLSNEIMRIIANTRGWTKSYQVKMSLATNPKTPLSSAMKFVNYLTDRDLRGIMRSRDVPGQISAQARRILAKKGKI